MVLSLLAVTLATYTLGPLSHARWAIQDDHEIAFFAGPTGRLPLSGIPRMLRETDIGQAGRIARFRPSYMSLRLLESSLWGMSPGPWYRTRFVLYVASVLLVGWVVAARIGTVGTVALLIWVLSAPYWFHVWGRLGPPESYAAFGCALWGVGIHLLWRASPSVPHVSRWWRWLGVSSSVIGNAIVVGAKENFLVLAVPNAALALYELRSGRFGGVRWWTCLTNVVIAVAVATPLVIYFAAVPIDYYGRSVAFPERLAVLGRGFAQFTTLDVALLLAVALWAGVRILARSRGGSPSSAWRHLTSGLLLASASALLLVLSQFVLYNGDVTPNTHYEFPAALVVPGLVVGLSLCLRDFFGCWCGPAAERAVRHLTALGLVAVAVLQSHNLREQRAMSRGWAAATADFTARITSVAATARAAPELPIVVVSGRPLDLEPIVAVTRFLDSLGASNARFLALQWESSRSEWTPLESYLAPNIERIVREGHLGFKAAEQLDPAAPCLSIGLSHEPLKGCQSLGRLW